MPSCLFAFLCAFLLILASPAYALSPDQIVLIANKNVPQSLQLANYYMAKRDIPQGHILMLDLPGSEQITYEQYEKKVVPEVRQFLTERKLKDQITCLVTFYGVPFRIAARPASKTRLAELAKVRIERGQVHRQLTEAAAAARQQAAALGTTRPASSPAIGSGDDNALAAQAEETMRAILRAIAAMPQQQRPEPLKQFAQTLQRLGGPAAVVRQFAQGQIADPQQPPAERAKWIAMEQQVQAAQKELGELAGKPASASTRQRQRDLVRDNFGLLAYARLLESQSNLLSNQETASALDNELALLWWDNYPRSRWLINPLHYGFEGRTGGAPVMMVMRLDAPQPGTVRDMILASLKAEQDGLKGRIVLDSRGIAPVDANGKPSGYGQYDQTIRNLALLVRQKVKNLPLTWDNRPAVFPPHSVNSVALYCGWYSLRNYIPSFAFNTGAVGFHIASYEMVSLHPDNERGWVHGLLNDGVVATLGPVAEPYLSAFPRADDFFPLLLTGKLPLAEVYWQTTPMTSWMICDIGDPLYTPFKNNPALKIDDLPRRLQSIFPAPATQ